MKTLLIVFNQEVSIVILEWKTEYGYIDTDGYHVDESWIIMEK